MKNSQKKLRFFSVFVGKQSHCGFTLLEIAIVLLIMGLAVGGGMVLTATYFDHKQIVETTEKLNKLQEVLYHYRRAFNRLPCPADIALVDTDANFGLEAAEPGDCLTGTPAANFNNENAVMGMLPIRQLGLPDEFSVDGFGRRFFYAVDRRYTESDGFITWPLQDTTTAEIIVQDENSESRTESAVYVLYSPGKDRHGGYEAAGGTTRTNSGVTNIHQLENCDCGVNGVSTAFDGVFVQREMKSDSTLSTNYFDDFVVFQTRPLLRSYDE